MTPTIIWSTWMVVMFAKALINQYQHQKEVKIHEGWQKYGQMVIVAMVAILHGIFIADVHTPKDWVPDDYTMSVLMFYPFSWWTFFDAMYNPMIGQKIFFRGKTAGSDKLFNRLGTPMYILSKVFALFITVVCIVIIYTDYV